MMRGHHKRISAVPLLGVLLLGVGGLLGLTPFGHAQLQIQADHQTEHVFAGDAPRITLLLRNAGSNVVAAELQAQLIQTSYSTGVRLSVAPWKKLQVLPGQTIVESPEIPFPSVRAETRFLIQWLEGTNRVLGTTEVLAYPTNLLDQLKVLAGEEPLGVFDPANQFKPLLMKLGLRHQDLSEEGTDRFHGKLAIFGPFESKQQMRGSLTDEIRALAKRGIAVVWLLPPETRRAPLQPSFYAVRVADGAVVVAQADLVSRLRESPQAQLNLIHLAETALHPAMPDLPQPETPN